MFTLEKIQNAHKKVKSGADFPQYIKDLNAMGVTHYDTFVSDGQSKFYDSSNDSLDGHPKYPKIKVNEVSSAAHLKLALTTHQQGQTDYFTFCKQAAQAGVEKWMTDIKGMTVTYLDKDGNKLLVEQIPNPLKK
ncbi:MAG: DUF1398 family protein [Gelidibacter sp.]